MLSKFVITYLPYSANIAYNNSSKAVEHSQLRFIHTMPKRVRALPRNDSHDEFADINEEAILESSRDAKRERRREQHRRSAKKVRSAKKKRAKEARDAPDTAPETADAAMEDDTKDEVSAERARRKQQCSIQQCSIAGCTKLVIVQTYTKRGYKDVYTVCGKHRKEGHNGRDKTRVSL
jgi:hypothetical protein